MEVASALTAEAILGVDFLESHNCTPEIGKRVLRFANQGVAIALHGSSPEPVTVQAQPCVPVRMINTQSESVVVFKGTKVGVVEETEGPPSTVAVVEPSTGESPEISEDK